LIGAILRRPATRYVAVVVGVIAAGIVAFFIYTNRPITVQVASVEDDIVVRVFGLGT
jgi:HlyD family secretion protein